MTNIPTRGDSFDRPSSKKDVQLTAEQGKELTAGATTLATSGLNLKSMTVAQIMAVASVSEANARILKNAIAGGGAGSGAIAAREINRALGNPIPEEYATAIGGGLGGFLGGLLNKGLTGKPSSSRGEVSISYSFGSGWYSTFARTYSSTVFSWSS